jgi:DNA-binding response OmpR family regulator
MSEKYEIVYADDDAISRAKISKILETSGFSVKQVCSGKECIDFTITNHPGLVILDVLMADMNGFEVSTHLKHSDLTCDIPIIFLTGMDNRFSIIKALKAGATDYIIKPVESKDLIEKTTAVLSMKNLMRDKINLLKVNNAMVESIRHMLEKLDIMQRVSIMKEDLEESSCNALNALDTVRMSVENYEEDQAYAAIQETESSLQFSDRVAQQLNELAKVFTQIQETITKGHAIDPSENKSLYQASTDSVLEEKTDQASVDDLLNSLDI